MLFEAKIEACNQRLIAMAEEIRLSGIAPVNINKLPEPAESTELRDDVTPDRFWTHYITSQVTAVEGLPTRIQEMAQQDQRMLHMLTTGYMTHPTGSRDPLNLVSCAVFLEGGFAFNWSRHQPLLSKLKTILADLSDQYSLREGRIPLGYTP